MEKSNIVHFTRKEEPEEGILYLVGTPIGNISDISIRAINILNNIDFLACEDTRRTGKLLKILNINKKLISFHNFNEKKRISEILKFLEDKKKVALVSDAGLPIISDPGEYLVKEIRNKGYEVICIPGPCAALSSLVTSGFFSSRFTFEGFLPKKKKDRSERLKIISSNTATSIIYESPHKLLKLIKDLKDFCGPTRKLFISRELTKRFEENIEGTIEEIEAIFLQREPKGEFTIIVDRNSELQKTSINKIGNDYLDTLIIKLIKKGKKSKEIKEELSNDYSFDKRFIYNRINEIKKLSDNI